MKFDWRFELTVEHLLVILALIAMFFGWQKTGIVLMIFALIIFSV